MLIPHQSLAADTLENIISEFVSRDGTDNGYEQTLEQRIQRVKSALDTGSAVIIYSELSESLNIITKQEFESNLHSDDAPQEDSWA